ncbi:MAG: hypothetical protein ACLGJC_17400 [Alphaproteobacteria bacterium]
MATIPDIRGEILVVASSVEAGVIPADLARTLRRWELDLHRRKPVQRTPPRRRGQSAADDIRAYAAANPGASYHEIANATRTTIGRVSEALAGKRT